MSTQRDFRTLASRVEIDFHTRKRSEFVRVWYWCAFLAIAVLLAACIPLLRGNYSSYAAGPVSHAHKMIENDCASCHKQWTLVDRLNPFSSAPYSTVEDSQCIACHAGEKHHSFDQTAHDGLRCADCHREHRGHKTLARITDNQCTRCHDNLKDHKGTGRFANAVTGFGVESIAPHPAFAFESLLRRVEPHDEVNDKWGDNAKDKEFSLDDRGVRRLDDGTFVDRSRLKFNHKIHLDAKGIPGSTAGSLIHLENRCDVCHEPDPSGRYMRPIHYERHCSECHPLLFDVKNFPNKQVPHESPTIVQGFLAKLYFEKLIAAVPPESVSDPFDDASVSSVRIVKPELESARENAKETLNNLPVPFHPDNLNRVSQRLLTGGGCMLCHDRTINELDPGWDVVPTNIPVRWLRHGEFNHHSHRMVDCNECHKVWERNVQATSPVSTSDKTEDVLIPGISVCRNCHSERPTLPPSMPRARLHGADASCVECHRYHGTDSPVTDPLEGIDFNQLKKVPPWNPTPRQPVLDSGEKR